MNKFRGKIWSRISRLATKCGVNKEFGSSFMSWICYNLIISSLPIPLAYVALSQGGDVVSIGERGDFFIITAALLAAELPVISRINKTREGRFGDFLFAAMFVLITASLLSLMATLANFAVGHQKAGAATQSSPPFPWFDAEATMQASLVLYFSGLFAVILSIAWRAKGKGGIGE